MISESHLKEPYYLGIVPKPPRRLEGMQDRGSYARKVSRWAWNFIAELEEKTAAQEGKEKSCNRVKRRA